MDFYDKNYRIIRAFRQERIDLVSIPLSSKGRIEMGEDAPVRGNAMSWVRKRYHRARFRILVIVIGLLWFAQRAGWFPLEIFGPLVPLIIGAWMVATSYFHKRQAPAFLPVLPLSCCGSQFRPDGHEATGQDQAAANKMLRPEGLSEQNHPQYRSVNGEHIIEYHSPVRPDPAHPFVP